ncbi:Unknown protein [Striga hermonthica]|uniref:Integrase catalytic domain-containing protein n=1 Tax=Striga hermonthica TaxID=68872 RepID=A0A9N7N9D1_STRHE|nr:Unknown protein [Striga hermonthica]
MEVESLGGSRYFLTFIDDASRKVWVYILNTKDQVFEYFKSFHVMVERETGKKLKCLRSDNGGEYTSKEFDAYCRTYGIRHEKHTFSSVHSSSHCPAVCKFYLRRRDFRNVAPPQGPQPLGADIHRPPLCLTKLPPLLQPIRRWSPCPEETRVPFTGFTSSDGLEIDLHRLHRLHRRCLATLDRPPRQALRNLLPVKLKAKSASPTPSSRFLTAGPATTSDE